MFILRWMVVLFLLLLSMATWVPHVCIAGISPDLLLGVVFVLALRRGTLWGAWSGFVVGLILATEEPSRLGVESLGLILAGVVVARGARSLDRTNPLVLLFLLFVAALVSETMRVIWMAVTGLGSVPVLMFRWALPGALYTTLWLPVLAYLASRVLGRKDWLTSAS
jgi:rod shape-determining protein MreD